MTFRFDRDILSFACIRQDNTELYLLQSVSSTGLYRMGDFEDQTFFLWKIS